MWMSKFAAFVNSVIWSWTHFRGLNDIKKFASIGVPLDDEDERHQISKTLPTAQQIQGFSALVKKKLRKLGLQNMENIKQMTQKSPED